jgi:hypothetical protein
MSIQSGLSLFLAVAASVATVACVQTSGDAEGDTATSRQAAEVPATAATVNGNCARPDEVGWEYPDTAKFKVAGGWTTSNLAGSTVKGWTGQAFQGCNTFGSPNHNRVVCYYETEQHGSWEGPQLAASKTFPSNYKCTCNDSNGQYRCIRQ